MNKEQIIEELYKIRSEVDNLIMMVNIPQVKVQSAPVIEMDKCFENGKTTREHVEQND